MTQHVFLFNPLFQCPSLLQSAGCCFVTLSSSRGPSPQEPYIQSLSFKHTQKLAYFSLSPGRLTTCQQHASGEQDLRLTHLPPSANPLTSTHKFCSCSAPTQTPLKSKSPGYSISNRAHFLIVSGCRSTPHTTTSSIFTKLHEALTFYYQAIRSYLECVTRAILHHLTDQEPPCKAGPGMSRYRFGEKREWGM